MNKTIAEQFELISHATTTKLSPRLQWIIANDIHTHKLMSEDGWIAWNGEIDVAKDAEDQATGLTEDDAIAEWSRMNGKRLWNESDI